MRESQAQQYSGAAIARGNRREDEEAAGF